jgi:hypothetical protein
VVAVLVRILASSSDSIVVIANDVPDAVIGGKTVWGVKARSTSIFQLCKRNAPTISDPYGWTYCSGQIIQPGQLECPDGSFIVPDVAFPAYFNGRAGPYDFMHHEEITRQLSLTIAV